MEKVILEFVMKICRFFCVIPVTGFFGGNILSFSPSKYKQIFELFMLFLYVSLNLEWFDSASRIFLGKGTGDLFLRKFSNAVSVIAEICVRVVIIRDFGKILSFLQWICEMEGEAGTVICDKRKSGIFDSIKNTDIRHSFNLIGLNLKLVWMRVKLHLLFFLCHCINVRLVTKLKSKSCLSL